MTRLVAKLKTSRNAYKLEIKGKLELGYGDDLGGDIGREPGNGPQSDDKPKAPSLDRGCVAD